MKITVDGHSYEVERKDNSVTVDATEYGTRVEAKGLQRTVFINDYAYVVELPEEFAGNGEFPVDVDGKPHQVQIEGRVRAAAPQPSRAAAQPKRSAAAPPGSVLAAMPGRVIRVVAEAGQSVQKGDVLVVLEAMKMENEVSAPRDGVVKELAVAAGARVNEGDVLVVLES